MEQFDCEGVVNNGGFLDLEEDKEMENKMEEKCVEGNLNVGHGV